MSSNTKHIMFLCSWYPNRVQPTNGNFIQKHAEVASLKNNVTVINIQPDSRVNKIEISKNIKDGLQTIIAYLPIKSNSFLKFLTYKKAFKLSCKYAEEEFGPIEIIHLNHLFPLGYLIQKTKLPLIISEHYSGFTLDNKLDSNQPDCVIVMVNNIELGIYNNFVFFKEEQKTQDIAKLLQESDALVMFSNYETFGIVCAEALACGTPIIATDIPATKELVNENNSILIETENVEMLTGALLSFIELPIKLNTELEHRIIKEKFSKEVISEKLNQLYQNCSN